MAKYPCSPDDDERTLPMRLTPVALLLGALTLGFTACGDDDDDDGGTAEPQVFEVQATDKGDETGIMAPPSVSPGAVEIRFSNAGEREHGLQIIRIDQGHTPDEALGAGAAWGEDGEPLPDWITLEGGVGSTKAGGSGIAVVDLEPGEYVAFDIEGDGPPPYAAFTVEGDEGEGLPEVPAMIEGLEYDFNASELQAGSQRVLFENTGEEPHHLVAAPLKPGATEADVKEFAETEEGPPPIVESKAFDVAIISGGESTVVDVRFESGDYGLFCFIPDRAGGPPHVAKGMATTATVE
jgi:hypothetical protein